MTSRTLTAIVGAIVVASLSGSGPVRYEGALSLGLGRVLEAQEPQPGPVWPKLNDGQRAEVMRFGDDFKTFIGRAKSAMTFVQEATTLVEAAGFKRWPSSPAKAEVRAGSRWYAINRDRTIVAFVIGTDAAATGVRIVNTHNDSVHLELKPKPFRESFEIALLDTLTHGGIKNYQWVNRPLALIGRVTKMDGTSVAIDIGHAPGDPVLLIPDLAPHVDRDFLERRNRDVIQTEELDPVMATTLDAALKALGEKYGLSRDDFLSTDLEIVPAQMPVDVGLDRQLVGAFGHDDRSNGFAAFRAIVEVRSPSKTAIAYGVNNEEVNSWTTGVNSEWFRTLVAEIIAAQEPSYNDLMLRHALRASQVLVSDCTTALDPNFPQPYLPNGSARLGWGLVFKEYGSGRQAEAEYFTKLRRLFNSADVHWQTHAYRAGYGGGTIAQWFANADIDAADVGIGILSMHSPMDVSAKVDIWELYRGFKVFRGGAGVFGRITYLPAIDCDSKCFRPWCPARAGPEVSCNAPMRIFLTGATGYVGGAVFDALVRAGHDITALVRDNEKAARIASRGARPVVGNLADSDLYRAAADAQDGYVHTAYDGSSGKGPAIERKALETILTAAKRPRTAGSTAPPKRFVIYTSGVWVLGRTPEPASETAPVNPIPHVSWRPDHEDFILNAATDHLRTMVVRPGVVYGGREGIVGDMFKAACNGLVRVVGDGNNHWPLIYARDLADLYVRLVGRQDAAGVYHANDEGDERVNDIVSAIAPYVALMPDVRHVPLDEARAKMGSYAEALSLDQLIRSPRARALGWSPSLRSVCGNAARLLEEWRTARN